MKEEHAEDAVLKPKTINIYSQFAVTLKRVHIRLIAEGYTIEDGEFTPPKLYSEPLTPPSRGTSKRRPVQ